MEAQKLNYEEAIKLMKKLCGRRKEPDVAVFIDRGWGDSGQVATYEIIRDGNGQQPFAAIDAETFNQLRKDGYLGGNTLITFKARKLHPFLNGKKDESTLGNKLHRDVANAGRHRFTFG